MELRTFQYEALNKIKERFEAKAKSALIVMPAGTGKTVLAVHLTKEFSDLYKMKSIAYVAPTKVLQSAFDSMITNRKTYAKVTAFLPTELVMQIENNLVFKNQFDMVIFDDFGDRDFKDYQKLFNHLDGFRVGFTRDEFSKPNDLFEKEHDIAYKYGFDQAVVDGYYFDSQKALSRHLFKNLQHQIDLIKIGEDWPNSIKESIIDHIDELKRDNEEFQKAQEMILSGKIQNSEILELAHKKDELSKFYRLINDDEYFNKQSKEFKGHESVWQNFFEFNPWIFGFGLNYIFNSPLEGKKLEQITAGHSITGHGKRIDALLKTTGLISTLCFGEIKTHRKSILKILKTAYRPDSWAVSDEIAGGIAQIHKTVQKSLKNITNVFQTKDEHGYTSYDNIYMYRPKSFLIIGSLQEFKNDSGQVHEEKFASFELFRRSVKDIEIITFDELYERANAIVNKKWKSRT